MKSDPKPTLPAKISVQRCETCGTTLRLGDDAVIHRVMPVAFCVPCAGKFEKTSDVLHKAVVVYE